MALVPEPLPLSFWGLVVNCNTIPGVGPPGMTSLKVGGPGPTRSMGEGSRRPEMMKGQGQGERGSRGTSGA